MAQRTDKPASQALGIRFEDKSTWERRTPLIPEDVAALTQGGARVLVETSDRRIFPDTAYTEAGAEIVDDLREAGVIFGVKEVPPEKLLPETAYVFFAHVIKGQPQNMPLLRELLARRCTLIDYEKIADAEGRRLVFFSVEAGQAGMIDSLHFLGRRLAWEGSQTPLAEVRPSYEYDDLAAAKAHLAQIGEQIQNQGLDLDDLPLAVGFTGRGQVTQGAWDIFDILPHENVTPEDLAERAASSDPPRDRLLKVCLGKEHLVCPRDAAAFFDDAEYRAHPERYRGGPLLRYLPHLTVLMHGVFWTDAYPRFLTRQQAADLWKAGSRKLRLIGDVTCDEDGSLELTYRITDIDDPVYRYDPLADQFVDGNEGEGIAVLAVDHLPCELPRDASLNFSHALRGFVPAILKADFSRPFEELELPPEIRRAVVTHRGELTPDYRYLEKHLG